MNLYLEKDCGMKGNHLKRFVFIAALCWGGLCACDRQAEDPLLEEALELAGGNRVELERVLAHYVGDSLKLEAAKYLIRHMPGHYSYADTTAVGRYYDAADSLLDAMRDSTVQAIQDSMSALSRRWEAVVDTRKVQDVETVRAAFLIAGIDSAFVQWREGPWARHLDFAQFCEYLLPYKAEELQPLDGWRTYLRGFHPDHLDELQYCDIYRNSPLQAGITLNSNLWYYMRPVVSEEVNVRTIHRLRTRLRLPFGTCKDFAVMATSVFRSQGIPVAMDFTPQWAFRSLGHSWNVLLSNDGRHIPFSGVCSNPGQPHKLDERMPKVFRYTYAMNPELRELLSSGQYVPAIFRYPFIKDVTEEYMDAREVRLEMPEEMEGQYAFLTVFDDKEWVPVDFARVEDGRAVFRKVGMNTVYLPVRYGTEGKMAAVAPPFLFAYGGQVRPIVADTLRRDSLVLYRKYPVLAHVQGVVMRVDSGEFQAARNARFSHPVLLHRITDCSAVGHEILLPDTLPAFRYWRYIQPKGGAANMADIRFYERGTHRQLKGRVIGTDGHWEGNPEATKDKVFDDDLLTHFDAPMPVGAWVGMDFGRPVRLERIVYTARGDGNTIDIGDTYELFRWDGKGWTSLGRQTAGTIRLVFKNVLQGGLYLLRDLAKGKDERIFTYEGGRQVWR